MNDVLRRWFLLGPVLLYSIILHEMAHGYVALLNGDPTALELGRLTLNPLPHLDLWGSIILPAVFLLGRTPFFIAWAKPVPYDPSRLLTNPRLAELEIALAGPATNLVLAFLFALLLRLQGQPRGKAGAWIRSTLVFGITLNVSLCVFNFLPVPPLDGSKLVLFLFPGAQSIIYGPYSFYGGIAALLILQLVPGLRQRLLLAPVQWLGGVFLRFGDPRSNWEWK